MLFVNAQWTKSNRYPLNKKISPHHVEQAPDIHNIKCHAPRERVSWNFRTVAEICTTHCHAPRERVSWNYCLNILTPMLIRHAPRERVSWNPLSQLDVLLLSGHAPRERVSWNINDFNFWQLIPVTLHVSVWVEIVTVYECNVPFCRHAPRERVSWNLVCTFHCQKIQTVTLHVSVWVEMVIVDSREQKWGVTLHVSVWVEIYHVETPISHEVSRSTWACELKLRW